MTLRELLHEAVGDDPWYPTGYDEIRTKNPEEIRLIALASEAVSLLIDMAEIIAKDRGGYISFADADALLARYRELEERA